MIYNFKERNLSSNFANLATQKALNLINNSTSFCVVGMPALGISPFLKSLLNKPDIYFIHLDIYQLSELSKLQLFRSLLAEISPNTDLPENLAEIIDKIKKRLKEIISNENKVVIVFNRFDQLKDIFNADLFHDLRAIRSVNSAKISYIFSANKPLIDQLKFNNGEYLQLISENLYLKPYSESDLKELLAIHKVNYSEENLKCAISLSGGHFQLLQLILNSQRINNPLEDSFVSLQLKSILDKLNYKQKQIVQKIAFDKSLREIDPFLLNLGIVIENNTHFKLFSPLLKEYLIANSKMKLPVKEAKLFKLLKLYSGGTVPLDTIYNQIWGINEESSDWALKSLIYRLRKNPQFIRDGFTIESHKKLGYSLHKS